jgi:heme A synthase
MTPVHAIIWAAPVTHLLYSRRAFSFKFGDYSSLRISHHCLACLALYMLLTSHPPRVDDRNNTGEGEKLRIFS